MKITKPIIRFFLLLVGFGLLPVYVLVYDAGDKQVYNANDRNCDVNSTINRSGIIYNGSFINKNNNIESDDPGLSGVKYVSGLTDPVSLNYTNNQLTILNIFIPGKETSLFYSVNSLFFKLLQTGFHNKPPDYFLQDTVIKSNIQRQRIAPAIFLKRL